MVRILEEFPQVSTGRPSVYNWEEWLDGQPRLIERGVDYKVSAASFRSIAVASVVADASVVQHTNAAHV